MEKKNKYIVAAYKMYADINGEHQLLEDTPEDQPFWFISDMGMALPQFDAELSSMHTSDTFDFVIAKAFGENEDHPENEVDLPKSIFMSDGKLDESVVHTGAVIPVSNGEGHRFNALILEIGEQNIKVALNHPLAGLDLHFVGTVLESRPATEKEIGQVMAFLSKGGCGGCGGGCGENEGGCGGCGGGCGENEDGCGGCGGGCGENEDGCGGCGGC